MIRARSVEELEPLLALCRTGRLFDVVDWVKQGKPVALPEGAGSKGTYRNPLRLSLERGFHSLVQVLLEAGAPHRVGNYNALEHAVRQRRPDLAALLFQHGARVDEVPMRLVIEEWDSEMVDLFIAKGADLHTGMPLACGLIQSVRPALALLKRDDLPRDELLKQANCALRHHAYEGHLKWVALLLWAGADPWAPGPTDPELDTEYSSAIECAALAGQLEVLQLKKLAATRHPERPESLLLLEKSCYARDSRVLELLLKEGHRPGRLPDQGTHAINVLLRSLTWEFFVGGPLIFNDKKTGIDSSRARERLKMLHMLLAHGARWLPEDVGVVGDVRRCLLKMTSDYLLEFLWLLQKYGAARRRDVDELLRTPSVARLLGANRDRAAQLASGVPESLA